MQWEPTTGTWIKPSISGTTGENLTYDQVGISTIDDLLKGDIGSQTAVGTSILSRNTGFWGNIGRILLGTLTGAGAGAAAGSVIPGAGTVGGALVGAGAGLVGALGATGKQAVSQLSGAEQGFLGEVAKLTSGLSLEALQQAKAQGATFGALSNAEWKILGDSATTISKWEIKDKDGNVIGYNIDEKRFKAELQKINNLAKLDYLIKGGKPEDVGVQITPDGRMWVKNFEGKIEEIKRY